MMLCRVGGGAGVGGGVGLIPSGARRVRSCRALTFWVPPRHALRPVELPVDTERVTHRYHRLLAGGFVLGGLVSIFGLLAGIDATAVSAAFAETRFVPLVAMAVESAKWGLIVGSAFGVVIGAMLLFYPNAGIMLVR